jgi:ribosome maturation factor RimP
MGHFNTIAPLIEPTIADLGFELVLVRMLGGSRPTLQIMAEPVDRTRTMTVEDCAQISHAVSAVLDVADPIASAYSLEVSSPGLDRPLVKAADYDRFRGLEARVEMAQPLDGRKRFQGRLQGVAGDAVVIEVGAGVLNLPLAGIKKAKLVLNDELLKRAEAMRG